MLCCLFVVVNLERLCCTSGQHPNYQSNWNYFLPTKPYCHSDRQRLLADHYRSNWKRRGDDNSTQGPVTSTLEYVLSSTLGALSLHTMHNEPLLSNQKLFGQRPGPR